MMAAPLEEPDRRDDSHNSEFNEIFTYFPKMPTYRPTKGRDLFVLKRLLRLVLLHVAWSFGAFHHNYCKLLRQSVCELLYLEQLRLPQFQRRGDWRSWKIVYIFCGCKWTKKERKMLIKSNWTECLFAVLVSQGAGEVACSRISWSIDNGRTT